jgi:hypothetical protein
MRTRYYILCTEKQLFCLLFLTLSLSVENKYISEITLNSIKFIVFADITIF